MASRRSRRRSPARLRSSVLASESWSGTAGADWSAQWTKGAQGGSATLTGAGLGQQVTPAAAYTPAPTEYLSGMAAVADHELTVDVGFGVVANENYAVIGMRTDGVLVTGDFQPRNGYFAELSPSNSTIYIGRSSAGVKTYLTETPHTFSASVRTNLRMSVVGGQFRVRAWQVGATEPTTWNIADVTDGTPYTTAGKVLLVAASGSAATARTVTWGNLQVTTPPVPVVAPSPGLFFQKTTHATKKQFAHYFSPNPISLDNVTPKAITGSGNGDYYDFQFLRPSGESGAHAAYGGWLRDRPRERATIGAGDYETEDMKTEIQRAQKMGIDGFFCNILHMISGNGQWTRYLKLVDAAVALNTGFKVIPMIDTTGAVNSMTDAAVATQLDYFIGKVSSYYTPQGKFLISCFNAEGKTPAQWTSLFNAMIARNPGLQISFACILLNSNQANQNTYGSISEWMGSWTVGPDVNILNSTTNQSGLAPGWARAAGKKWCGQSLAQLGQPYTAGYDEVLNSGVIRASWNKNIRDDSDIIQQITWNDFTEGTHHAPSVGRGWAALQIGAYYAEKWKTGSFPAILADAAFLSHRDQPLTGATYQSGQTTLMAQHGWFGASVSTPRHQVEVLTYLTASATVNVTIGGVAQTPYTAAAGEFVQTFNAANGTVSMSVVRSGQTIISLTSPFPITSNPVSQDRQYFFVSSLDGTSGQHPMMSL